MFMLYAAISLYIRVTCIFLYLYIFLYIYILYIYMYYCILVYAWFACLLCTCCSTHVYPQVYLYAASCLHTHSLFVLLVQLQTFELSYVKSNLIKIIKDKQAKVLSFGFGRNLVCPSDRCLQLNFPMVSLFPDHQYLPRYC